MKPRIYFARLLAKLTDTFGQGQILSVSAIAVLALALGTAAFLFTNLAAPTSITIATGPKGSSFERNAEKYKQILAKEGVTVKLLPTAGSSENFKKLLDPKVAVDVGFVLGGEVGTNNIDNLVSLGSISYQPLMVFYRGEPKQRLSEFQGLRIDIGPEGSGAHSLALTLLKANGIGPEGGATFVDAGDEDLIHPLLENRVDAIFVMGESTPTSQMRELLRTPNIHLYNVTQAEGYVRRIPYLNKLVMPEGAIDFGKNIPSEDTTLIGPTVELIAREGLHPALSDLLLEAAREVHGKAGLYKKRSEFPSAQEHEIPISQDASRYYTSGKSFLYRTFPYQVASLIARIVAFIVPVALLLIPALKLAPAVYRWRMQSRVYRWYRLLQDIEHDALQQPMSPGKRQELLKRLDHIEHSVSKLVVPPAFGYLLYGLRGHICFVRDSLAPQATPEYKEAPLPAT